MAVSASYPLMFYDISVIHLVLLCLLMYCSLAQRVTPKLLTHNIVYFTMWTPLQTVAVLTLHLTASNCI